MLTLNFFLKKNIGIGHSKYFQFVCDDLISYTDKYPPPSKPNQDIW